ncbi:hypothetical protein [Almyronema epifaneia]|uniref:SbsA Ig-like domain-containing protein n=1 Tax=Almyronema epifaneia S1 TaxID=2991925 RepID=A0ABW6IDS4_9CYAN
MSTNRRQRPPRWLAIDRVAISFMAALAVATVLLLLIGDRAAARVRSFSWNDRHVGAEDVAFLLTFSRPMDHTSVEANLRITPPLSGKFSWAGRRMAYTLNAPIPYGESFEVALPQARDRFTDRSESSKFLAFQATFQSRDRAFVYLGVEGEEKGRLVLFNLTHPDQQKQILTPANLVVLDFEPYPLGDRILFSATDVEAYRQGLLNQKLYTVTTGLQPNAPEQLKAPSQPFWRRWLRQNEVAAVAGVIEPILDSQTYQNLKFDLAPNGELIVVQRVNQQNPADFGPWIVRPNAEPQPLKTEPGGDFVIAPDSQTLVMLQGEGTAVIPLPEQSGSAQTAEPLEFLADYGRVLDIASDGSAAAMVNFNQNNPDQRYTESLFWVTNQGEEKELLTATGSILAAEFDPTNRILYCLATELIEAEDYVEQPVLTSVNVETGEIRDLLVLPPQRNISVSLAPDGLALLFDQVVSIAEIAPTDLRASDGSAITNSRIWLLPLFKTPLDRIEGMPAQAIQPEELPFSGLRPTWLP